MRFALVLVSTLAPVAVAAQPAPPMPGPATHGLTGEISASLGVATSRASKSSGVGGLDVGLGGFVTPDFALLAHISDITALGDPFVANIAVVGLHIQAWTAQQLWLGAGFGAGLRIVPPGDGSAFSRVTTCDVQLGYAFSADRHGVNISLDIEMIDFRLAEDLTFVPGVFFGYQGL